MGQRDWTRSLRGRRKLVEGGDLGWGGFWKSGSGQAL